MILSSRCPITRKSSRRLRSLAPSELSKCTRLVLFVVIPSCEARRDRPLVLCFQIAGCSCASPDPKF